MKKKITALLLSLLLVFQLCGCALINVDPDRDNAQVIATIGDENINKVDFNCYMAFMELSYKESGYSMPTGKNLTELKENIFDSIVDTYTLALKADQEGLKIDDDEDSTSGEETYKQIVEDLGEDAVANILNNNYVTTEQFIEWYDRNTELSAKAQKAYDEYEKEVKEDPSIILDEVVGKIGDEDVTRKTYDYYYIYEVLKNNNSSDGETLTTEEMNESVFNTLEFQKACLAYCEDNDIEISEDKIKSQKSNIESMNTYYGLTEDNLPDILDTFYLSEDDWDELTEADAKASAAGTAIYSYLEENATVSDNKAYSYYEKNKDTYNVEKVSAMHILTEDKALAQRIYEKAKNKDKENFEELIKHYEDDDRISEATDLGSFDYDTMVEAFSEAAFNADVGTVVGPVKTEYGYHVIFVYDKSDGSYEDSKDEICETLKTAVADNEYSALKDKLQSEYKITIYDIEESEAAYATKVAEEMGLKTYPRRLGI